MPNYGYGSWSAARFERLSLVRAAIVVTVAVFLVGCSAGKPPPTPVTLGSRAGAIIWFEANGFTGKESPLADGTPRWLANGPLNSLGEVQGPGDTVTSLSLVAPITSDSAQLTGVFLNEFAPGSRDFLSTVLAATQTSGAQDQSERIGGHIVRVQTADVGSGTYEVSLTIS